MNRFKTLAVAIVLAAAAHAWLLHALPLPRSKPLKASPVVVASVVPERVQRLVAEADEPAVARREPLPPLPHLQLLAARPKPAVLPAKPTAALAAALPAKPMPLSASDTSAQVVPVAGAEADVEAASASASTSSASAPPPLSEAVPVYSTAMPPAFNRLYELRKSILSARGVLTFKRVADGYEASLDSKIAGILLLDWKSRGAIDANGLAPLRFVEQRRGKSATAANFQRKAGSTARISYSTQAPDQPLPAGTQDRLTWMLQLAAIAAAQPSRLAADGRIVLYISDARSDAEVWTFGVVGRETIETPLGPVASVHLLREPRKAHDTRAEVWLDPERNYLPAKARLANGDDDSDAFELTLQQVLDPP